MKKYYIILRDYKNGELVKVFNNYFYLNAFRISQSNEKIIIKNKIDNAKNK